MSTTHIYRNTSYRIRPVRTPRLCDNPLHFTCDVTLHDIYRNCLKREVQAHVLMSDIRDKLLTYLSDTRPDNLIVYVYLF